MEEACDWLSEQETPNYSEAAHRCNVSRKRVRRCFGHLPSRVGVGGRNKASSAEQEEALCRWIDRLDDIDIPLRYSSIDASENSIFRRAYTHDNGVPSTGGPHSTRCFPQRYPKYQKRKQSLFLQPEKPPPLTSRFLDRHYIHCGGLPCRSLRGRVGSLTTIIIRHATAT